MTVEKSQLTEGTRVRFQPTGGRPETTGAIKRIHDERYIITGDNGEEYGVEWKDIIAIART
ncbi:hypothetical protein BC938DRAFT_478054 [Jimgerdemannia flammicorona]|uniref:Hypervirulence associated protein TUDOR domain-containing protein n=1 Tax=Jimgerdemannia flammicorona TaxID=994334 RepID=A0A433QNI3_9FUNG|nr:hypothetical protein BC938DRAFT_478054 [Jimgerdemannia flammicorona]